MVQGMGTPRRQRELNVKADEVVAVASLWLNRPRRMDLTMPIGTRNMEARCWIGKRVRPGRTGRNALSWHD